MLLLESGPTEAAPRQESGGVAKERLAGCKHTTPPHTQRRPEPKGQTPKYLAHTQQG